MARSLRRPGRDSPVSADSSIERSAATSEATVGGHPVAGLEQHDVAGDELVGDDLDELAVAAHPHLGDRASSRRAAMAVSALASWT